MYHCKLCISSAGCIHCCIHSLGTTNASHVKSRICLFLLRPETLYEMKHILNVSVYPKIYIRIENQIVFCCYEISPQKKCNSSTWNISFSHFDFVRLRIPESSQFIVHSKKSRIFVWLPIDILSKHFLVLKFKFSKRLL